MPPFRLGTRGSPLALTQAHMVQGALAAAHGIDCEIVVIKTTGDAVQDRPLAEIGGKALWTQEIDRALLAGEVDASVHSMKDVETFRPDTIRIAAMLARADVRDRIVGAESVAGLKQGAVVGTSSPRRAAQLLKLRPDLKIVMFRGNVDTRLGKLAAGEADATLLAAAGLERLGREIGTAIPVGEMLPAPSQGAVGIEVRASDAEAMRLVAAIDHPETHACVAAERALLAALKADCHSPVGALATIEGAVMTLRGELLSEDGAHSVHVQEAGAPGDTALAETVARDLLDRAPPEVRRLFDG